jgi:hypothetical protein
MWRASAWLLGVFVSMVAACGPSIGQPGDDATASSGDDGSGTGMTGMTSVGEDSSVGPSPSTTASPSSTASDATDTTDPTVGDETTAGGFMCPQTEDFMCSGQYGCDGRPCADNPMSAFDANGCLRPSCPCDAGMVCFTPADWGGCVGSEIVCGDDPKTGQCVCGGTDDCGGSYCLPEGEAPPVACGTFVDEEACLGAGCSAFVQGRPITDRGGGACLCDLEEPWCLFVDPGATALPNPAAYVSSIDGRVLVFEATWDPPPFGWIACAAHPDPPPECACAAVLPCAMGGG